MNQNKINRKIILLKAGIRETDIARALGVTQQAVNNEMRGIKASKMIRNYICGITQTTPEEFWPEFHERNDDAHDETTQT